MLARIRKSAEEKDQGFTLIELLVVIIIIGILAAIAIPVFLNQRKKGWDAAIKSDLKNLATSEETYLTETGHYTATVATLTDWKQSQASNYDSVATAPTVPTMYTGANAVTALDASATGGYCLQATSASGNIFKYNSTTGGLATGACP
jgi:type IV pilus assembly protein PilA